VYGVRALYPTVAKEIPAARLAPQYSSTFISNLLCWIFWPKVLPPRGTPRAMEVSGRLDTPEQFVLIKGPPQDKRSALGAPQKFGKEMDDRLTTFEIGVQFRNSDFAGYAGRENPKQLEYSPASNSGCGFEATEANMKFPP